MPAAIGGLTVIVVVAVLVVANLLPSGSGGSAVSEITPLDQEGAATTPLDHDVGATSAGPDIHFAVSGVDLGKVPLNTEVGYAFSYANVGNETLVIEKVDVRVLEGC